MTTKSLFDIIGEGLPFQSKNDKKFTDLHKSTKITNVVPGITDRDDIFKGDNVKPATAPGKSGTGKDPIVNKLKNLPTMKEGVMDVYGQVGGAMAPDDDDASRNQAIQDNMQSSQQYKQQGQGHTQLAANHNQIGNDMNQDSKLRGLHKSAADLHNQLNSVYNRLSKYHDGAMQDIVNGGGQ